MHRTLSFAILFVLLNSIVSSAEDKEERKKFEGVWKMVSVKAAGKEMPKEIRDEMRLIMTGDSLTIRYATETNKKEDIGSFRIEAEKKWIDLLPPKNLKADDQSRKGIYKFEKNRLHIALGDRDRPGEFNGDQENTTLMILEKVKEKE